MGIMWSENAKHGRSFFFFIDTAAQKVYDIHKKTVTAAKPERSRK